MTSLDIAEQMKLLEAEAPVYGEYKFLSANHVMTVRKHGERAEQIVSAGDTIHHLHVKEALAMVRDGLQIELIQSPEEKAAAKELAEKNKAERLAAKQAEKAGKAGKAGPAAHADALRQVSRGTPTDAEEAGAKGLAEAAEASAAK